MSFNRNRIFDVKTSIVEELEHAIAYYSGCVEPTILRELGGEDVSSKTALVSDAKARLAGLVSHLALEG
jgi:hypothetical protein